MRIAIGQLWQETNTNNPLPTTREDFEAFGVLRGQELLDRMADTNEPGGFIQSLRAWPERPELVGLVRLPAWPSGVATEETFAWLEQELLGAIERAGKVDAVLLALHGAMVADGTPDVEGAILERVRRQVGHIPVVATLDLHANVTRRMAASADALVLYHTAPHIDVFETGQRGARVLRRILDGARPVTAFVKLPMVVPAERANTQDPASVSQPLMHRLRQMEADPRVLSAGLATVQPWLDIPEMGGAVVVVTDGDAALARTLCAELAEEAWRRRRDYLPELVDVEEAVRQAQGCPEGLVVLSDSADATTSGAPGDSTHLLRELLRHDWLRPVLVPLVAPDVVAELSRSKECDPRWTRELGGKRDHLYSRPLKVEMELLRLFDSRFVLSGHLGRNLAINMGRAVVLRQKNVHVLVTSRTGPHFAPEFFRAAGFDPFAASVLVAKSPCGFRAAYQERAAKILVVRAPGCAPSDFWNYPYRQIPRPLWPWDEIEGWRAEPTIISHPPHEPRTK
jgi:microcystin degradation protein MlrC